ncbi:Hypothetical_protein [Hexamita inflata]|uniref:Hypothetical_protein n=1 Tax=Hexamita inflata TaxID=28002 RepID=A0AA86TGN4_9EUKA|nr:Hypothetical protein HINF_LOCUS3257 [Hexamita inflata]
MVRRRDRYATGKPPPRGCESKKAKAKLDPAGFGTTTDNQRFGKLLLGLLTTDVQLTSFKSVYNQSYHTKQPKQDQSKICNMSEKIQLNVNPQPDTLVILLNETEINADCRQCCHLDTKIAISRFSGVQLYCTYICAGRFARRTSKFSSSTADRLRIRESLHFAVTCLLCNQQHRMRRC